jgi:uncharacterized membrane protein YeiH
MSASVSGTLKVNKVKTIGVDANTTAIHVVNRSQVDTIWVTVDGTVPAIGGGGTETACTEAVEIPTVNLTDIVLVRLVCATAVAYTVWGDPAPE